MTAAAPPLGREPFHRRTGSRVRRDSRPVTAPGFFRPVHRTDKWKILDAAKAFDDRGKAADRRNGPLGYVALKLLDRLLKLVDHATGRLDPSLLYLAKTCRLSKSAVVAGLARLQAAGFLERLRRFVPTGNAGQRGPQVEQATNAYRLAAPAKASALLKPVDVPVDFEAARAARAAEIRAMAADELDDRVAAIRASRRGGNASRPGGQNPSQEDLEGAALPRRT